MLTTGLQTDLTRKYISKTRKPVPPPPPSSFIARLEKRHRPLPPAFCPGVSPSADQADRMFLELVIPRPSSRVEWVVGLGVRRNYNRVKETGSRRTSRNHRARHTTTKFSQLGQSGEKGLLDRQTASRQPSNLFKLSNRERISNSHRLKI